MLLTIFTPTFNREHTLKRTFESLYLQENKDFEWLVVDDGSTDGTADLIHRLQLKADFPIKYIRKENGGKHTAYNIGLQNAVGDFFFDVDSDDWLPADFMAYVSPILHTTGENNNIVGFLALKSDRNGILLCRELPEQDYAITYNKAKRFLKGEYSYLFRTSFAKKFVFPVFGEEKFMPETVVYDMFDEYEFALINKVLTVCEYQFDGLSMHYDSLLVDNPKGFRLLYSNRRNKRVAFFQRIMYMIQICAFTELCNRKSCLREGSELSWFWKVCLSPLGKYLAKRYMKRAKQA